MEKQILNAKKLIKVIEKKLYSMECGSCTLKGVKNLSVSDLETIKGYAQHFIVNRSFYGLLEPLGSVKEVLEKYNVI